MKRRKESGELSALTVRQGVIVTDPPVVVNPDGGFEDKVSARLYLSQQYGICPDCMLKVCVCNRYRTDVLQDIVAPVLMTLFFVMITASAVILIFSL